MDQNPFEDINPNRDLVKYNTQRRCKNLDPPETKPSIYYHDLFGGLQLSLHKEKCVFRSLTKHKLSCLFKMPLHVPTGLVEENQYFVFRLGIKTSVPTEMQKMKIEMMKVPIFW